MSSRPKQHRTSERSYALSLPYGDGGSGQNSSRDRREYFADDIRYAADQRFGLIVPVQTVDRWCRLVQEVQRAAALAPQPQQPQPLTLVMDGAWWRDDGEVWPTADLLRPGTPVYLAFSDGGDSWQRTGPMRVRCCLRLTAVLGWQSAAHGRDLMRLWLDPASFRSVQLDWTYSPQFYRAWRYARWTPVCEHDDPNWQRHPAHPGCVLGQPHGAAAAGKGAWQWQ